ncbi:MAG: c-type cytochrome, partial [Planctomycetaceae bacterium]
SPVGVAFGYGTKFPAKYQKALYICDWTFGTMYAIHLEPEGSTYKGVKEEFVARTPLPLTDMVVGRDGAIYFTVGGRGGQSELYRVTYAGPDPTAAVDVRDQRGGAERALRHDLEALHRRADDPAAAVAKALPHLASPDRFVRYAARIALEHQPLDLWQSTALASAEPRARIAAAIAVARQAEPAAQAAVLAALDTVDPAALDVAGKIDLARAYELATVRLGEPPADAKARIAARLGPLFPSGSFDLDRELASLLVGIRAPGIVTKLVKLLAVPTGSAGDTNLAPDEDALRGLIARNAGYGGAVRASLEKRSDLLQVHYAYVLRTVHDKDAWTADDARTYYAWFPRAREWGGGASFGRFLENIKNESLARLTDTEKLALEAKGILERWVPPPLPKPEGPGRAWTVDEVLAKADTELASGRNFEHGKRTFAAARCVVCHRFGEEGGATGPDLTQAGGRFQVKDLVEAIVLPSKVISDQYKASIVETTDGRIVSGRIVSESPEKLVVVTDPEDATKFVELARADVEAITTSPVSLMPQGLLDQLNETEVLAPVSRPDDARVGGRLGEPDPGRHGERRDVEVAMVGHLDVVSLVAIEEPGPTNRPLGMRLRAVNGAVVAADRVAGHCAGGLVEGPVGDRGGRGGDRAGAGRRHGRRRDEGGRPLFVPRVACLAAGEHVGHEVEHLRLVQLVEQPLRHERHRRGGDRLDVGTRELHEL